ncbi:hydroxypyruvate isomerase [Desulfosporosinus sp. BICA1-9]|uniref:hydroxypyruvate isomerase n=1 Tax=Desulfosporosinus sp. BICA1-9 TaxID=1531958 RepID=UPI00054B5657|nr:hydroxypyruvate isomerase [Desulfosporosinus sp. BICA1-9]KJS50254.1 MAG: hydroxypyruvate isomerase [Peptococcaceae bacterium BRH_c23]KJS86790.1 MAG: hydroxypyruvate isomerase [Desulfosporosinus sp. BICA1-9]HBW37838.1 hydroxypyruvate isomerase [Desulfosporosinus sp.]
MGTDLKNFVANLSFLFTELPFMERFRAAKAAGFAKVEFMFPYDYDLEEIKSQLNSLELKLVLFNLPAGDWGNGERGIAVKPERKNEFRAGVGQAIVAAQKLGVTQVNCLVGKGDPELDESVLRSTMVENISYAAKKLEEHGLRLMIEPINHYDIPGFFLNTTDQVLKLIAEINRPNVFLQWDIYHASRENEDLWKTLSNSIAQIGHIQIADQPGRHQPGTGEIAFQRLLTELKKAGYSQEIALEYVPGPDTETSLRWVKNYSL